MNVHARALAYVALIGMTLAALTRMPTALGARLDLEWGSLSELQEVVRSGNEKNAELESRIQEARARVTAKGEVIRDLRGGRLTLAQAAARFRDVEDVRDPGPREQERLCREVIRWAEADAQTESWTAGERTRRRLESELAGLLARGGRGRGAAGPRR
jgi:hypothetical protein